MAEWVDEFLVEELFVKKEILLFQLIIFLSNKSNKRQELNKRSIFDPLSSLSNWTRKEQQLLEYSSNSLFVSTDEQQYKRVDGEIRL